MKVERKVERKRGRHKRANISQNVRCDGQPFFFSREITNPHLKKKRKKERTKSETKQETISPKNTSINTRGIRPCRSRLLSIVKATHALSVR